MANLHTIFEGGHVMKYALVLLALAPITALIGYFVLRDAVEAKPTPVPQATYVQAGPQQLPPAKGTTSLSLRINSKDILGRVEPGKRVDLLHREEKDKTPVVFLENLRVRKIDLDRGKPLPKQAPAPKSASGSFVTLDFTTEQLIKFAGNKDRGDFLVVLRTDDEKPPVGPKIKGPVPPGQKKIGLDHQLEKGKRAFAIKADAETTAGGLILPGAYVDVIYTFQGTDKTWKSKSCYILQNVRVLAVDMQTERPRDKPGIIPQATVTLLLDPMMALDLANSMNSGKLRLVLRADGDDEKIEVPDRPEPVPPPPFPPPAKNPPEGSPVKNKDEKTVKVLVAKEDFKQWQPVNEPQKMFVEIEFPLAAVPKNAVSEYEDLNNKVLLRGMKKGELVCKEFLESKQKSGIEPGIQGGNRAITFQVAAKDAVGGFILPGSRVDVFRTIKKGDKLETTIVLENVLIRAIGLANNKADGSVANVTFEVAPQDALELMYVKDEKLKLVLRPFKKEEPKTEKEVVPPPK